MDVHELLAKLSKILDSAKVGVLATVDGENRPHLRWMTPTMVDGRDGLLYAVTSPKFDKVKDLEGNPEVEWLIQTRPLDAIVTLRGSMSAINNPQLKSEILEAIGRNLQIFWRVNPDETDLVVLETVIREAEYMEPLAGVSEQVAFP
jgi:pyridoxamine 5'-phosphate oxidase